MLGLAACQLTTMQIGVNHAVGLSMAMQDACMALDTRLTSYICFSFLVLALPHTATTADAPAFVGAPASLGQELELSELSWL